MHDWYRNGVIYALDVETFKDGNGDGVGDFCGVTEGLDYLNGLGVDCVWLLPIFCSPNRDNGYDVSDFLRVDPRLGDLGQFAGLLEAAEDRGLRVLVDLPINHTSIDHPWFQTASLDRDHPCHEYYIWCDEKPDQDGGEPPIFGDRQDGNWAYADGVGRWYYHTFYDHQPDLNYGNPAVVAEIRNIMRFWLRLGVHGFRIDAAAHMIREKGPVRFGEGGGHAVLRQLRRFVEHHDPVAVMMAEVDAEPEDVGAFFGDDDEFQVLLNFYLCNCLFLGFARGQGRPIREALQRLPDVHRIGQWGNFLRNHDELDLQRLKPDEFDDVMAAFAPEPAMRAFGRGIRRRMAPMLGDDRRRLEMAYSLLLSLPGTPVFYYGDEIAMGEDLSQDERRSVRTTMQWSPERNGGFSTAERLSHPALRDAPWGYLARNMTDQRRDPGSLLNWMSRAIHLRRDCPEFGRGRLELLDSGDDRVLVHRCREGERFALAVHNLSDQPVTVRLDIDDTDLAHLLELFGDTRDARGDAQDRELQLQPYGYRWLRRTAFAQR